MTISNLETSKMVMDLSEEIIRVLHVDDDCVFLKVAKECLEMQGSFNVDVVSSVEEAFEKLKKEKYDVVISDYKMPGKDGLEFLKELRQSGNTIPFVIFTGKGREEVAIKALNIGADGYFNKSGAPETVYGELMRGLCQIVEKRKTTDALHEREEKAHTLEMPTEESRQRFEQLFMNNPEATVYVDHEERILNVNPRFVELFGYSVDEINGKYLDDLIVPEDRKKEARMLAEKGSRGYLYFETVRKNKKGSLVPVALTSAPILLRDQHLGRIVLYKDITERRNAEKTITMNQQKFEALFKYNPEAMVYLDLEFRVLDANSSFCQLFGHSADEAKGKHIFTLVEPEDKIEEAETLYKKAEKGYAYYYTARRRKGGSKVLVSISTAPIFIEGKPSGYVMVYKNIKVIKKEKEELEESHRSFHTLFNLILDPVAIVDDRGKILEITKRVEEITGYTREELVGKNFFKLPIASNKTKLVMSRNLAKRMRGVQISPYEVELLTKDGEKLAYEINAAKIDFKGKPADIVVFRDISANKKLEEKLRVVGSLTRHDVRNKLTIVAGSTYLLRQRLAGDPRALGHLEDIDAAVRQVEKIFEFARIYEKLGVEELVYIDMKQILKEAASLFSDLKGVEIVSDCNGVSVLADSLLRQVFYNLIDNSLRYGEKIKRIRVHYEDAGNQLKLIYEDDGVGISDDMRSSLFKEGGGKGTGYGLFTIKRICEVYGWMIEETGKQGKGSQFTVTIPRKNRAGKTLYKIQE